MDDALLAKRIHHNRREIFRLVIMAVMAAVVGLALGLASMILVSSTAYAAPICGPYDEMIEQVMGDPYNEAVLWHARANNDGRGYSHIEMYVNQETGTWTIFLVDPNPERNVACSPVYGDKFTPGSRPAEPPGSPT